MGENFHELWKIFVENTFTDCSLVPSKDTTPLNFTGETFVNGHKTSKFLSLESFTLYVNIREGERKGERQCVCTTVSTLVYECMCVMYKHRLHHAHMRKKIPGSPSRFNSTIRQKWRTRVYLCVWL